ncbi:MAG: DUF4124 domain-containing protein [Gammaproteobacteria bacterium]|nr:MAG: DUF4124 domain-containing protein [Gammaproteobacteria bacterium]
MQRQLRRRSIAHMRGRALPWILVALAIAASAWWYLAPQTIPAALRGALPTSPQAIPEVYKWKDDKGRVHFTSTPPTDRPYETLRYDPKMNVVPSVVPPQ